jgi:hypothetical protein
MSDRGALFLFSLVVVIGALAVVGWLIATSQAATFDGLLLLCSSLALALAFSLYLRHLIRSAMKELAQPPAVAHKPAPKLEVRETVSKT